MKEEWKHVLHSTWIKVVLIAITVIPMLYAGVFLGSMWDPYGNADKIPVAVVNHDKQVMYNDKSLHVGNDLVENLKNNKAMDFQFVDSSVAKEGLKQGTYYMMISIPENFSYNATTLLDREPQKMVLDYATNPGSNYIASKMDESAITKIKENVSATISQTYADTLLSQVKQLSVGLFDASEGTKKLAGGVDATSVGNTTIKESLTTLSNSSLTFYDGTTSFEQGLTSYVNGVATLQSGSLQLSNGLTSLQNNSSAFATGVRTLASGSTSLKVGLNEYMDNVILIEQGVNQVASKSSALKQGMTSISMGATQVSQASEQVAGGIQQVSTSLTTQLANSEAGIKQLLAMNEQAIIDAGQQTTLQNAIVELQKMPEVTTNPALQSALLELQNNQTKAKSNSALFAANNEMMKQLETSLKTIQFVMNGDQQHMGLQPGMEAVNKGISSINAGLNDAGGLVGGVDAYTTAVGQVQDGVQQLAARSKDVRDATSQLTVGTTQLNQKTPALLEGIDKLYGGASSLYQGATQLTQNNTVLLQGVSSLENGSLQLSDGAKQIAAGSSTLGVGLDQLKKGATTLDHSLVEGANKSNITSTKETSDMLATPLVVKNEQVTTVENNGEAMAPYMMSVGMYVACMAFTLMYPLLKNTNQTKSGFKMWLGKASVMYVVSTCMALFMVTSLILVNGLAPQQVLQTMLMACLIAAGFMSMIVFFNILCGKVGSFLVLIFMVFQLGGAAGTYPIETSSSFYNMIHPYMPFSYSVDAFRHTLAIGGSLMQDSIVFIGMILVFSLLSIVFYRWKVSIREEQFDNMVLAKFQ